MTQPRFHYTQNAWQGKRYDRELTIKDIAKLTRQELKARFPHCKFSVTIERYSMGQSLHISLMEAPFNAIIRRGQIWNGEFKEYPDEGYAQLNHYQFKDYEQSCHPLPGLGWNNGSQLTKEAWHVMRDVCRISTSYNFDDSDGMIDYFHTNFYLHVNIGKWNKPFKRSA